MRCGEPGRPHRPKRLEVTDDRGRTTVVGMACKCGLLTTDKGGLSQPGTKADLTRITVNRHERKARKARERMENR